MLPQREEYSPAEDTFLLCDYIDTISGDSALDIGSGSGYVTKVLEDRFEFVACTEINYNILLNQTYPATHRICCQAADALCGQFDVIVSNPPYLATDSIQFQDTDGGIDGVQIPGSILRSAAPLLRRGGHIAMITSSLSRYDTLMEMAKSAGLSAEIVMRKKLFFEELYVMRAAYL